MDFPVKAFPPADPVMNRVYWSYRIQYQAGGLKDALQGCQQCVLLG